MAKKTNDMRAKPDSHTRGSRISPSETVIELKKQKRRRKNSLTSGSGLLNSARDLNRRRTFISRHFDKRECLRYIEVTDRSGNKKCGCGLTRVKHSKNTIISQDAEWTPDKCTIRIPTDAYGEIKFDDQTNSTNKPYVRLSDDTKAEDVIRLMTEKWELELPTLVISVTGGAKSFNLKPRLKEVFNKGLIKVAVSTGAWIITGGTNTGVMQHVGEAVKHRGSVSNVGRSNINVIGIAPWGVLESPESLISKDGLGLYPAKYKCSSLDTSKTGLDHNHSHFLLVDNGTTGEYGTEIQLRSRVENALSKCKVKSKAEKSAIDIPVVILCLEGGPNTIKTMLSAIQSGTPAVVIDGSGRAADVVSYAYKHLIDGGPGISVIDPEYVEDIQKKVEEVFGKDKMLSVYNEIEALLRNQKMISVFRLDDNVAKSDMDLAILRALLKANKENKLSKTSFQMQLKLALAWKRIDVAKSEIFTEDLKQKASTQQADTDRDNNYEVQWLYESMHVALLDNKPDFVELFFHEGVNLSHFLTLQELKLLYKGIPENTVIHYVFDSYTQLERPDILVDMYVVGQVIEDLMGDRYKSRYKTDVCYQKSLTLRKSSDHQPLLLDNIDDDDSITTPHMDLFMWAVLCNRRELARLLWQWTPNSIACALMASKLLQSLADYAVDNKELSDMVDDLLDHSRSYELMAVGVLEKCREEDDKFAQALLVKELPDFGGNLSSLDIAVSANSQDFIAHTSCQTLFNRLWMGELYINTKTVKVIICIFMPFLINVLITFHEDKENDAEDALSENIYANEHTSDKDENRLKDSLNGSSLIGSEYSLQKDFHHSESQLEEVPADEQQRDEEEAIDCHHDEIDILGIQTKTGYFKRIVCFHDAPFVKFVVNVLSYAFFLLLYAFIILTRFNIKLHPAEYVLQAWVFTLLCEEIRQVVTQEPKNLLGKLEFYFLDPWNIADTVSLFGFIVATSLRYVANTYDNVECLVAARIIYATDIVLFIIRLLQIFSVNRHMGPKLVMIRKMLDDLVYFVVILAVFVIGYGVAKQAVLFPNSGLYDAVVGVLNRPYWQMYGELFIDDILEDKVNCTTGLPVCMQPGAEEPCIDEYGKYVAPVYMAVYMLFTNILLLNLLIAIFNYTFEKIQEDSDKVWKFQRYDLISEYRDRPALCPPFIIVAHIFSVLTWIFRKCSCSKPTGKHSTETKFFVNYDPMHLIAREFVAAETYIYESTIKDAETQDERIKTILNRVNFLTEEIEEIKCGEEASVDTARKDVIRPETSWHGARARKSSASGVNIESRLAKMEFNMQQILELIMLQNQKQAAILEASQSIMSSAASSSQLNAVKSQITTIHTKARMSPYPGTMIKRWKVPDDKVLWQHPYPEYKPTLYTAPFVLSKPYWADIDLISMSPRPKVMYNAYDEENKVNRISHVGFYEVIEGLPRNPYGRTGMRGRGSLGRFGPNHAADPVATRWKRTSSGIMLDNNGKRVLEFIAIQRRDNQQWAIPGGMVEPGEHVSETLRKEFTEEALAKLNMSEEKRKQISDRIAYLFKNGVEVYKGYVDDPRNTDHAWMETVACNFHDDTGEIFGELQLQAGDDAQAVRWQRVSGNIPLFASHVGILEKVAKMHGAAFY